MWAEYAASKKKTQNKTKKKKKAKTNSQMSKIITIIIIGALGTVPKGLVRRQEESWKSEHELRLSKLQHY